VHDEIRARAAEIRSLALRAIHAAGSGHPGGSLSCAEILASLYFEQDNGTFRISWHPDVADRDRVVLSKGHACPAWYAALHLRGWIGSPVGELRRFGSALQGHPDVRTPGIDAPSGSLGNGLSIGVGMALGLRHRGRARDVYVVLGDGDLNEGTTWEALMAAAHYRLGRLTAILDANGLQGEGPTASVMALEPLVPRLEAFGWHVAEVDGHDVAALLAALAAARGTPGQPSFIIARTVKGKGVSFMEGVQGWHGSRAPSDGELVAALAELAAGPPRARRGTMPGAPEEVRHG
jgi:transketolase